MPYAHDVGLGSKSFLLQLKKDHPFLFEHIMCKEYLYGCKDQTFYLVDKLTESEKEMPELLQRTLEDRTIWLRGSAGVELQIFDVKRYIESHKNKFAKCMRYNMDYLMIDESLHKGEWKGFSYDVTDPKSPDHYWLTPPMSAAKWRKILNAMLCILKNQYRQAKAEEKKPKRRKVPFKTSMYAVIE